MPKANKALRALANKYGRSIKADILMYNGSIDRGLHLHIIELCRNRNRRENLFLIVPQMVSNLRLPDGKRMFGYAEGVPSRKDSFSCQFRTHRLEPVVVQFSISVALGIRIFLLRDLNTKQLELERISWR